MKRWAVTVARRSSPAAFVLNANGIEESRAERTRELE